MPRDHPFKTSANFYNFWTLPPSVSSFFTTICRQIWPIFDPSPLKNADVLNGWSLTYLVWIHGPWKINENWVLLLCCQTMSKVMKSISTLRSYSCEQCKAFSFFTKNVWMQCSLNADWGGKKRFQVMYTNGKARKMTLSLRYFCWKLHFLRNKKLFFWSVNKVWTFWEAHKIWKNLSHDLDVY